MKKNQKYSTHDVVYARILPHEAEEMQKRIVFIAEELGRGKYRCFNITSAKKYKDNGKYYGDVFVKAENTGLDRDSFVKTDVEYIVSSKNIFGKLDVAFGNEDIQRINHNYDKLKAENKVVHINEPKEDNEKKKEFERLQEKVMSLSESFQEDPRVLMNYLQFASKFHQYSARNKMLVYAQNPYATFVAPYGTWEKLGYSVRKGQKSKISIFRPQVAEFIERNGKRVSLSQATSEEKAAVAEKKIRVYSTTYYVPFKVFDISQTTCPSSEYPKFYDMGYENFEQAQIYDCVKQCAQVAGFKVIEKDLQSISLQGFFNPSTDEICISDKLEDSQRLMTLNHEFAHALLHKWSDQPTEVKEFEAQALACMMYYKCGQEPASSDQRYLSNYYQKIKDWPDYSFADSFSRIEKAYNFVGTQIQEQINQNPVLQELQQKQSHERGVVFEPAEAVQEAPKAKQAIWQNLKGE